MNNITHLKSFFSRPGINKSGICREMGISIRHMENVLTENRNLTDKFYANFVEVSERYGGIPEK